MRKRHSNRGLRKVCGCARRQWPKCSHTWHLNFRFKGTHYRLSLDRELDRHIAGKTAAASEAEKIRTAIREGTFRQRDANPAQPIPAREALTLAAFAKTYFERRGKPATANDSSCLGRLLAFIP